MDSLETRVDDVLARGRRNFKFTNWSTTFSCTPELYFEPQTTEDIREVGGAVLNSKPTLKCHTTFDISYYSLLSVILLPFGMLGASGGVKVT